MIIIADSGSTKTEWRYCTKDGIVDSTSTVGLNPLSLDKGTTLMEMQHSALPKWVKKGVEQVHFYSAGIVDDQQRKISIGNLKTLFRDAEINVNSDLLGAARAVFGHSTGVVGILGTGSNTGYYNGDIIEKHIPALGYILADEGSGAVLGKTLIRYFLRNDVPMDISELFKEFYPDYTMLIETIYSEKHAAKFLASFVPFLYENRENDFIKNLLLSEFDKFIKLLQHYPGKNNIGIVGSVGFHFQSELTLLATNAGVKIRDFVKSPIEKLVDYHQDAIK